MRENVRYSGRDRRVVIYGFAILVCTVLGPFGTSNDLSFWDRLVFWVISVSAVGLFMEACMATALESPWVASLPIALRVAIGGGIGAIPGTSVIIFINRIFRPEHLETVFFPTIWAQVTFMSLLIAGLELAWHRTRPESKQVDFVESGTLVTMPRLSQRLPDRLREGQIVSLSMQDHYVEVTTTLGTEMLLLRLSDAIEQLDGLSGVQTHRSHWAAKAYAESCKKVGRRHALTLSDGRSLPVSTSYREAVLAMLNEKGQA